MHAVPCDLKQPKQFVLLVGHCGGGPVGVGVGVGLVGVGVVGVEVVGVGVGLQVAVWSRSTSTIASAVLLIKDWMISIEQASPFVSRAK